MATGIPQPRPQGAAAKKASLATSTVATSGIEVELVYPGKQPVDRVLLSTPESLVPLRRRNSPNLIKTRQLYYADNFVVLSALRVDHSVRGHVKLIYIDPPFATKGTFQSRAQKDAYEDILAGPRYLEFLRQRLILLRELLAEDGSIYVHLDENMAFHVKILMDEVFGSSHYRNWITRKKCNPKNYTRKTFGNVSDYILFYTKSDDYIWNRPVDAWTPERASKEYEYIEGASGRAYKKVPLHAPGVRNGATGQQWRGMLPPPGKHWQFLPSTLDEMNERGEIYWSATGNPRRKIYLDQSDGIPVQDIWLEFRDAHNQNIRITGYPTEKNPDLLRRILLASSNPGDIVLDCFSGSGTTLDVAERMGRDWIGIDNSIEAIRTTLRRFVHGTERMGDFVGSRQAEQETETTRKLTLFDAMTDKSPSAAITSAKIDDFDLYTTADLALSAEADLAEWLDPDRPLGTDTSAVAG